MQITGGWVYDPDEGFAERTVCTDGEKIARISTDTKRLDAAGCYVLPLLIDLHIHGYAGADAGSADPAELERMARALLMQGVGAFCPTTMTLPEARLAAVCRCTAAYCKERHPAHRWRGFIWKGRSWRRSGGVPMMRHCCKTRIRSCSDASRRPEKGLYG